MFTLTELEQFRRGDPRGMEAAVAAFGDRVYRICRNVLGDADEAEDATQEVFLRAASKVDSFADRSPFEAWLHRIAVRHALNLRRARGRRLRAVDPVDPATLIETIEPAVDAREELDALLSRLPDEQRVVIVLREIEQMTYDEIAHALEVPIGTVMSRLSRARDKLRAVATDAQRRHEVTR